MATTPAPGSEHRLVILRRGAQGDPEVLLLKGADGWALPRIESKERRSADVADLNRAAGEALGLEVSVLRCLADEPGDGDGPRRQLYVLEAHGATAGPPPKGAWMAPTAVTTQVPEGSGARTPIDAWLRGESPAPARSAKPDWTRLGWRGEVLAWAAGALVRRGLPPVRRVEQVRIWEFSHVLRLDTDAGRFYLKARPSSGAAEAPLTQRLAERHPAWTPAVVAVEPDRRWLLTRESPGHSLMVADDPGPWESAAAAIARMQVDWLEATSDLIALGCPRFTLAHLELAIAPLLADTTALQPPRADGLTDAEVAALRQRQPELEALCRELGGEGVPESLEHGDLWAENAIAGPQGIVLIDWEDAAVAHPFFTPSLLLLSLDDTEVLTRVPDARRRIRDAYLGPWRERGPLARWPARRLERTFELAQQVAMLYYACQFWRLALPMLETSWEVRAFAPLFLRRLLTA